MGTGISKNVSEITKVWQIFKKVVSGVTVKKFVIKMWVMTNIGCEPKNIH